MGRKKTPSVRGRAADTSLEDGGFTRKEADASKEQTTEADRAHAHAVEVCDRIIRELDEQLEDRSCTQQGNCRIM